MEQIDFITDAELMAMRQCAQFPHDAILDGDIDVFRKLIDNTLWGKIKLVNCKFT